jgi:hypothetical protein
MTRGVWVSAIACALTACVQGRGAHQYDMSEVAADFEPVSKLLGVRCGSLDCHGQTTRNLRWYSSRGLRLSDADRSGHGGTRAEEHAANLASLIGLEPELFARVVEDEGRDPFRLTVMRKATAREHHLGGAALPPGNGASCVTSWLAGALDQDACTSAADWEWPE